MGEVMKRKRRDDDDGIKIFRFLNVLLSRKEIYASKKVHRSIHVHPRTHVCAHRHTHTPKPIPRLFLKILREIDQVYKGSLCLPSEYECKMISINT